MLIRLPFDNQAVMYLLVINEPIIGQIRLKVALLGNFCD
jgi:hypothetical protein